MSAHVMEKETRPNSCGCGKCLVEITFSSQTFKTRSLQIAAGVKLGERLYLDVNRTELLLWAQECQPGLSDKIQAIYDFFECPRILEYAEKFEDWRDAVKAVRQHLVKAVEKKKTEITVKIVYQRQNNYEQVFKVSPFVAVEKIYSLYYQALTFRQQPFVAGKSLSQHGVVDGSVIYSR